MESIVIGTAGHIDHGKTTLVQALTGRNTDTLEEEKRRGITINLGFAYFTLPNGKIAGIVDVPGHEHFVKNMLAGACGMDIAMVVIAANEGIMPQTKEHIDILKYMDIAHNLVVLTKIDMVDEEFKALVIEDTKDYLSTTFLKDAPVFEVDSVSGKGIDAVIDYINRISDTDRLHRQYGDARMSVDRVFHVKGFGTVVTGTLSDGVLQVDDDVAVYPGAISTKVRTLQIHEQDVQTAHAGQRTAMNLAGIRTDQVNRGSVIAKKDSVFVTKVLDVQFSLTASAQVAVKRMFACKLYINAKELTAKIVPLGCREVQAGQSAYAQIILNQETAMRRGDPFVLRTISPVQTIGGGRVLDPNVGRRKTNDELALQMIAIKDTGDLQEVTEAFVQTHPFQSAHQLLKLMNVKAIAPALNGLLTKKRIVKLGDCYVHQDLLGQIQAFTQTVLTQYHKEYPLREGMPKAEFASRLQGIVQDKAFDLVLEWLARAHVLENRQGTISDKGFQPTFSAQTEQLAEEIKAQIAQAGYTLLSKQAIIGDIPDKGPILESLLRDQYLLIQGQFVIPSSLYEQAIIRAKELYARCGAIRLSDFRDALGTSRRHALLLLERFDKEKITKRVGEDRVLR